MLIAAFPNLALDQPHIHLCHLGRRLGYRGDLKVVEQLLGIPRPPELRGVDGRQGILFWNRWRHRRDEEARHLLLAYNEADCVNLQPLADRFFASWRSNSSSPRRSAHGTRYSRIVLLMRGACAM